MKKTLKRALAFLLCAALLCGFAVMPQANAQDPQSNTSDLGEHVVYGVAGETTYVPAGYTYVYEGADGQVYSHQTQQDTYVSTRVLTAQEAEALANLEYGQEGYMVDENGQTLVCKEFNAQQAAAYSDAVKAVLDGVEVTENDQVSVLCEAYTSETPVRALITFEDKPVIRMQGMSVSLGTTLGQAELQAVQSIEARQLSIMAKAEKKLGYDIEIDGQFSLLTNAVSATVNYGDLAAISQMDGVKSAILMPTYSIPEVETQTVSGDFELEPNMKYAGPGMGAGQAWDLGYKGEGMSVAIIDTGLAYKNPAFSIEPSDPNTVAYTKEDIASILNAKDLHAEALSTDTSIDTVYYSSKIPFGFNYGDSKADFGTDDNTWMGHGSHVAGIVAGNLPEELQEKFQMETMGIAPEAQLITMKVFNSMGNCYYDSVAAAMEDAILLGVDCVNLSLGSPCGPVYMDDMTEVYDAAVAAGINVVTSAGNDAHSGVNSFWGDDLVKSDTVCTGTVGMPGSFDSVLTVASANNSWEMSPGNHFSWYNAKLNIRQIQSYQELREVPVGKGFKESLKGNSYAFTDSFEDADGKLVFIPFAGGNADSLIAQAAEAGAAGMILCVPAPSNDNGWAYAEVTATRFDVPTCVSDMDQYNWMLRQEPSKGLIRVDDVWNPSSTAGQMSSFSSWGPTDGLTLKPEITGIGGGVFSAYYGENFAVSSGTSMASPAVAASATLLREYLTKNGLVSEDLNNVVNRLLMSTATPVFDEEHGTYYFVRRQGAGLANIGAAMASNAYIAVEGTNKAKLELGDDPDRTGVYNMEFEVVNFSDTDKNYTLDSTVLGQKADGGQIRNGEVTYLTWDYARNLEATVTTNLENGTVTVPANGKAKVTVTVALTDAEKVYYDERFPAGAYVEGFIQLLSDETPNLTVPFLGFYGDFDDAPILEEGTYETILSGEYSYNTADQFHSAIWSQERVGENPANISTQKHYLGDTNAPGYVKFSHEDFYEAAMRGWATEFYPEEAGLSPNNDGNLDILQFGFALRRNAENIHYTVTNRDTGELLWEQDTGFMAKTYSRATYAGGELSLEWLYPKTVSEFAGMTFVSYDYTKCLVDNDTWLEIRADVTPEGADSPTESKSFTLYIDNDEPVPAEAFTLSAEAWQWSPEVEPTLVYKMEFMLREKWFMDYCLQFGLSYNEETGTWEGMSITSVFTQNGKPANGLLSGGSASAWGFEDNNKSMFLFYDYAGNVSAYEINGGENLLDYVDLKTDKTEIMVGDTLTVRDEAEVPFTTILDWEVSDPTVAEIVESDAHSVTIRGLSRGTVTVYGGFGAYKEGIEIEVLDPDYEAIKTQFTDIQNHWAKDDIVEAVYRGLFKGVDGDTFAPESSITRAQLVTVLYRMAGSPETTGNGGFRDVPENTWYTDAVAWGKETGIVKGVTENTFCPNTPVTREQFATFLYRYTEATGGDVTARAELSAYTDNDRIQSFARDAMSWAVAEGLIQGTTDTTLSPRSTATRAQAATILIRYLV